MRSPPVTRFNKRFRQCPTFGGVDRRHEAHATQSGQVVRCSTCLSLDERIRRSRRAVSMTSPLRTFRSELAVGATPVEHQKGLFASRARQAVTECSLDEANRLGVATEDLIQKSPPPSTRRLGYVVDRDKLCYQLVPTVWMQIAGTKVHRPVTAVELPLVGVECSGLPTAMPSIDAARATVVLDTLGAFASQSRS